ncbi:MAG: SDR family oxidoreductase [Actinobacteria bacterium]|nr:MAG: SDR family oxidoreductase [Actinomycetota bacterium]
MPLALVTGATAGIGAAFARTLAGQGYDLVLVARDAARLSALADELSTAHGISGTALPADLSTLDGCALVERRLADPGTPVDLLVNNAGIGLNRSVLASSTDDLDRLLDLNVRAVQRLTHAALTAMVPRRQGAVVNVSSVAGFLVMPGSTYSASKAWVTNFSESVGLLARRHGVRVMALCPGYVRTEFHERAGIDSTKIPGWLWLSADDVVRYGLRDLRRGLLVSVPAWRYKAAVLGARYVPRAIFRRAAMRTGRRLGRSEPT